MKPLKISLLPERKVAQAWPLVATLSVAAALTMVGWLWNAHQSNQAAFQELKAQRNRWYTEPQSVKPAEAPYMADVRRALDEGRFDTSLALTALERVQVEGVLPESTALDAPSAISRATLEYPSPEALLKYVDELNAGESFARWHLVRETSKIGAPINAAVDGILAGGPGVALLEAHWN